MPGPGDVLELIRDRGALTRGDVLRLTGLSRMTVSGRIDALLDAGLVREKGTERETGGRPSRRLVFSESHATIIAASVDTTHTSVALTDLIATEPSDTLTQDFQLLSPESAPFPWLAGVQLYRQDASNLYVFPDTVSAQPAFPVGTDVSNGLQDVLTEAYALFAQVSYPFREQWTATFGGRWSRERKSATLEAVPNAVTRRNGDSHDLTTPGQIMAVPIFRHAWCLRRVMVPRV